MNRVTQATLSQIQQAKSNNFEKIQKISRGLVAKYIEPVLMANSAKMTQMLQKIQGEMQKMQQNIQSKIRLLEVLNPEKVLAQGYAILSGKISPGNVVKITTFKNEIEAEIKKIKERKQNDREKEFEPKNLGAR